MTDNLSPQFGRKYLYYGHANGPSHKEDYSSEDYYDTDYEPLTRRMFHGSPHNIPIGGTVEPTEDMRSSAERNGLLEDLDHDPETAKWADSLDTTSHAWASSSLKTAKYYMHSRERSPGHIYEVEPITVAHNPHRNGELYSDSTVDPHGIEENEAASPTGYRVVQEVTPNGRK